MIAVSTPRQVHFDTLRAPLDAALDHYRDRVALRLNAYGSEDTRVWELLHAFLMQAHDSFVAVRHLTREALEPHRLPVQAGVVARSAVETLGNVLCLTERPRKGWERRALAFWRDACCELVLSDSHHAVPYAKTPLWKAWVRGLHLSPEQLANPKKLLPRWPRPGALLNQKDDRGKDADGYRYLSGDRLRVFELVHGFFYGFQSRMAHPRSEAVWGTLYSRTPTLRDHVSDLCTEAIICSAVCLAAVMSEIESVSCWPQSPPTALGEAWAVLRPSAPKMEEIYQARYAPLLPGAVPPSIAGD